MTEVWRNNVFNLLAWEWSKGIFCYYYHANVHIDTLLLFMSFIEQGCDAQIAKKVSLMIHIATDRKATLVFSCAEHKNEYESFVPAVLCLFSHLFSMQS